MKDRVAIITDTTSDLSVEYCNENNVFLIPLKVVLGGKEYRDRIDITPQQVYDNMDKEIPTTSTPSFGEVMNIYRSVIEQGYNKIISIHLSSALSSTISTINNVANELKSENDNLSIAVIDGKSISYGTGMLVHSAVEFLKKAMSFDAIVDKINNLRKEIKVFFVLDTLEYLHKGGRIGHVSATLGSILNLKPVIGVNEDGSYYTHAKVRGRKKSIEKLLSIVKETCASMPSKVAALYGGCDKSDIDAINAKMKENHGDDFIYYGAVGPVIGVHTGPGTIGMGICPSWDK